MSRIDLTRADVLKLAGVGIGVILNAGCSRDLVPRQRLNQEPNIQIQPIDAEFTGQMELIAPPVPDLNSMELFTQDSFESLIINGHEMLAPGWIQEYRSKSKEVVFFDEVSDLLSLSCPISAQFAQTYKEMLWRKDDLPLAFNKPYTFGIDHASPEFDFLDQYKENPRELLERLLCLHNKTREQQYASEEFKSGSKYEYLAPYLERMTSEFNISVLIDEYRKQIKIGIEKYLSDIEHINGDDTNTKLTEVDKYAENAFYISRKNYEQLREYLLYVCGNPHYDQDNNWKDRNNKEFKPSQPGDCFLYIADVIHGMETRGNIGRREPLLYVDESTGQYRYYNTPKFYKPWENTLTISTLEHAIKNKCSLSGGYDDVSYLTQEEIKQKCKNGYFIVQFEHEDGNGDYYHVSAFRLHESKNNLPEVLLYSSHSEADSGVLFQVVSDLPESRWSQDCEPQVGHHMTRYAIPLFPS